MTSFGQSQFLLLETSDGQPLQTYGTNSIAKFRFSDKQSPVRYSPSSTPRPVICHLRLTSFFFSRLLSAARNGRGRSLKERK